MGSVSNQRRLGVEGRVPAAAPKSELTAPKTEAPPEVEQHPRSDFSQRPAARRAPAIAAGPVWAKAAHEKFKRIAIAVESRGGFGDLMAGLMTAEDLAARLKPQHPITLVVTRQADLEALRALSGAQGDQLMGGRIVLELLDGTHPSAPEPVDLLVTMATKGDAEAVEKFAAPSDGSRGIASEWRHWKITLAWYC